MKSKTTVALGILLALGPAALQGQSLAIVRHEAEGRLQLVIEPLPAQSYWLKESGDLVTWDQHTMVDRPMVIDLGIPGHSSRFFRLDPFHLHEDMILVEGGTLPGISMGELNVSSFYLERHEVTWGEWRAVRDWAAANGYDIGDVGMGCGDDFPVQRLSWHDALKWCNAKSELAGLQPAYLVDGAPYRSGGTIPDWDTAAPGYRLPSEAEWEFAARGGNKSGGYLYSGGNNLDDFGWYFDNSGGAACDMWDGRGPWPVGQKEPNELGFLDMSGNVWEWCWDEQSSTHRRLRGGSWNHSAEDSRVSYRFLGNRNARANGFGFRVARTP